MLKSSFFRLQPAFLALSFLLSACGGGGSSQALLPTASAKLVKLADCTQLETRLKTELARGGICHLCSGDR